MTTLKDLMLAVKNDLPITVRMERWMLENVNPQYSEKAIQHSDDFLRGKVGGNRKGRKPRFRASGMGKCPRQRIFARLGTEGISEQYSSTQANIFATGNVMHMKWQMAGLTEGWLTEAEVPLENEELDLAGTADGIIYDGSLFEFKTINDRGYQWVTSRKTPNDDHVLQVGAYGLLEPSLKAASVVYENKNTGEWREYRVPFTDEVLEPVKTELDMLTNSLKTQILPEIKPGCLAQEGMEYRRCPFRDTCLKTKLWPKGK